MTSQNIIEIVIRALDQASAPLKKVDEALNKTGKDGESSNQKITKASDATTKALNKMGETAKSIRTHFANFGTSAHNAMGKVTQTLSRVKTRIVDLGNSVVSLNPRFKTVAEYIKTQVSTAVNVIKSHLGSITSAVEPVTSRIKSAFSSMSTSVSNVFSHMPQIVSNALLNIASKVDSTISKINKSWTNMKTGAKIAFDFLKQKASSTFDTIKTKANNLSDAFNGLSGQIAQGLGVIGAASITQLTIGLAMSRDKMTALMTATMGSADAAKNFISIMDEMTNNSVVSLDMMINSMNKIKLQTGMSNDQLVELKDTVLKVGEASILMGDDTEHATFVMAEALAGLNGDFQVLKEQFGITRDKMLEMGWSGQADDVESYNEALLNCLSGLGNLGDVMQTTTGKVETIKKNFRTAGRTVGEMFVPYIDEACDILFELKEQFPQLFQVMIIAAGGISLFASFAPTLAPIITAVESLATLFGTVGTAMKFAGLSSKALKLCWELQAITAGLLGDTEKANILLAYANSEAQLTEAASSLGLAGALQAAATAAWELTIALLSNPWTWVAIAIITLVATLAYLYQNNEQVRESLNNLWDILKGGLIQAWDGLVSICQQLYTELVPLGQFIYNTLVKAWLELEKIVQPIVPTFQNLWNTLVRLWNALTGCMGGADGASGSFSILSFIVQTISTHIEALFYIIVKVVETILAVLVPTLNLVINIISAIINFIAEWAEAFNQLMNGEISYGEFLEKVWNALVEMISKILEYLGQAALEIWNNLVLILSGIFSDICVWLGTSLTDVLTFLSEWFAGLPGYIAEWFMGLFTAIDEWLTQGVLNFNLWLEGIWNSIVEWFNNLLIGIVEWFMSILIAIGEWLTMILVNFTTWLANLWNGLVSWLAQLPGMIWTWLLNIINQVIDFGNQVWTNIHQAFDNVTQTIGHALGNALHTIIDWAGNAVTNMINAGANIVKGFVNVIPGIPQGMKDELFRLIDNIQNMAGQVVDALVQMAHNMVDGFLNALGIHSPGHMAVNTSEEMDRIVTAIDDTITTAGQKAGELGDSIQNNFNPELDVDTSMSTEENPITDLAFPFATAMMQTDTPEMSMSMDTSSMTETNALLGEQYSMLATTITDSTTIINEQLTSTQFTLETLAITSTTSTTTILLNNTEIANSYNVLTQQIQTSLNTIIAKNTSSWNNIKQVTNNNLQSILSSTKTVTTQMIQAWETMKDSIITAATNIQTQSSSRFDTLWTKIKTFYSNIQHPGGAGPRTSIGKGTRKGGTGAGFRNMGTAMSNGLQNIAKAKTKYIGTTSLQQIGMSKQDIDYVLPNGGLVATIDILRQIGNDTKSGAGDWSSVVKPNTEFIRTTTNNYQTGSPIIADRYPTSVHFKVGEFENSTPTIDFPTFKQMAEDVFDNCHYLFYWDSDYYGHWIPAFHAGWMNCNDSTEALIAMANACGLSATKVHGHWNEYGHFWANVAGHKMDTTGWMQRRTWTPSASHAGPAPKGFNINKGTQNAEVTHEGDITIHHVFSFEGNVPEGFTRQELEEIIQESVNNRQNLKELTKNPDFQELITKMNIKLDEKIRRHQGVPA